MQAAGDFCPIFRRRDILYTETTSEFMTALFERPDPGTELLDSSNLRLRDILKTLPRECFTRNATKAWTTAVVSVLTVALGYGLIILAPWYLLPLAWVFTGTAMTGFFVIGHDCGHRSFAKRRWVNDWVGHAFMLPLIYPFHSWRILHNFHHKHTNKLDVDNAWRPFQTEFYDSLDEPVRWGYRRLRTWFWWIGSIIHWQGLHFDWRQFEGKQRSQVRFSALLVIGFAAIFFPALIATTGIWGFVKFWLLPWMVYHFWMSTFTLVHHTAPDIQFRPEGEWKEAIAQLAGTVHCDYPRWVEFLCHDINVHIPHHISTAIPSYNLRLAHQSLQQNWGSYLIERRFSWELMRGIAQQCHLFHGDRAYQSFQEHHGR
jgi:acyl-lipid omega-6 desaturase (Delta-12 desaturase)